MCVCGALELEAHPDLEVSFTVIEQSPAGVTWSYNQDFGLIGRLTAPDGQFEDTVLIEWADAGPDVLTELVAIDEVHLWMLGTGGIYRVVVEDLAIPGIHIKDAEGLVGLDPIPGADYAFHLSSDVDDMDVAVGYVWWVEGRAVYRMAVDDPVGTPEVMWDLYDDFPGAAEMLIAAGPDRLWFLDKDEDPTVHSYGFGGVHLEAIPLVSNGNIRPTDMTVERNTGVLAIASVTPGD